MTTAKKYIVRVEDSGANHVAQFSSAREARRYAAAMLRDLNQGSVVTVLCTESGDVLRCAVAK